MMTALGLMMRFRQDLAHEVSSHVIEIISLTRTLPYSRVKPDGPVQDCLHQAL